MRLKEVENETVPIKLQGNAWDSFTLLVKLLCRFSLTQDGCSNSLQPVHIQRASFASLKSKILGKGKWVGYFDFAFY